MNPSLAMIIFVIGILLSFLISKYLLPQFYIWGQKLQQAGIYTNQNLMQFFHAFKEVVLLGKRQSFVDAFQVHSKQSSTLKAIQTATNSLPRLGIEILFVGLFVLTISYLSIGHESPMQVIGVLSGYLYAGFRLMPGLNRIINQLNIFKSVIPSILRVHKEYTTVGSDKNYLNVKEFKFEKSIIFKGMSFKYLNTNKNALSKINFKIIKGECIGIVGKTGSGKSTLIDLLLGLLKPTVGKVLVDDKFHVNSFQWHKKIGYVPQTNYLVDDTIEANIAFGEKNIDQDKLDKAIDASQLRRFINSLPQASKTIVGERGVRLSGGERQRIAIARALYRNPEVLIFDEATSSLDNETEVRVMKTIHAVSENRTVIMIAHRLSTLKDCNRIIRMDKGSLKSIRNQKDIGDLSNKKGQYAKA
jgi:ATP-binding cassette subfamily C protein